MTPPCTFLPMARLTDTPVSAAGVDGTPWAVVPLSSGGALVTGPLTEGVSTQVVVTWGSGETATLTVTPRECVAVASSPAAASPVSTPATTTAATIPAAGEPSATTITPPVAPRDRSFIGASAVVIASVLALALLVAIFRHVKAWSNGPPTPLATRSPAAGDLLVSTVATDEATTDTPVVYDPGPHTSTGPPSNAHPPVAVPTAPPTMLDPDDPATVDYAAGLDAWLDEQRRD